MVIKILFQMPDGDEEILMISDNIPMDQLESYQTISLKIMTAFGMLEISNAELRESELKLAKEVTATEEVAVILYKSISRILAESNKDNSVGYEDKLKEHFDSIVNSFLTSQDRMNYDQLFVNKSLNQKGFNWSADKENITKAIMDTLQEKVSLTYASPQQKKRVKSWKQRHFSIEEGSSEEQGFLGFIRDIADFFAWHFGYSSEIEADYIKQLQAIVAELSCDEEIYLAENGRGEREELLMKVKDVSNDSSDLLQKVQEISSDSSKRGMKAYLLERVVKSHSKDRKTLFRTEKMCGSLWINVFWTLYNRFLENQDLWENFKIIEFKDIEVFFKYMTNFGFDQTESYDAQTKEMMFQQLPYLTAAVEKSLRNPPPSPEVVDTCPTKTNPLSNKLLGHLDPRDKKVVEKKIEFFESIYNLRELYGRQCYIGFIGPQNAGKSSLLNALWQDRLKEKAETGHTTHTSRPTKYHIAEDIFGVDFPGSNSLKDDVLAGFEKFGHMNNMFIYIMEYNGAPDTTLVSNVKSAYRILKISGEFSKILFCLNKAQLKCPEFNFDDNYKQHFIGEIKEHIRSHPYDETEASWLSKISGKISETYVKKVNAEQEAHKNHVLEALDSDDFIFTDWKIRSEFDDANRGVQGSEEVRRRIRAYLTDHLKIRAPDNLQDI